MSKTDRLIQLIPKLDVITFTGLAKLLGVRLVDDKNPDAKTPQERYAPRAFNEVLADVLQNFNDCNRARRREILQIVSAAAKSFKDDADNS